MDSVVGDDLTLPVDLNGSCRLPDSVRAAEYSTANMTAPFFSEKMSPAKVLTMKDYENQITALKKENFNLKLRIYFMEERMQQKCDDSTEEIFKTNIELKVELESMKREMAEKQELLVSASKALESFAGHDSQDPQKVREQAQKEIDALRMVFNQKIADMAQTLQAAESEIERMALIAEQEKCKSINMEKQLQSLNACGTTSPDQAHDLQKNLEEKDSLINQLKDSLKEANNKMKNFSEQTGTPPSADQVKQLSDLVTKKDLELEALRGELLTERSKVSAESQESEAHPLENPNLQLTQELIQTKKLNGTLSKTLEKVNSEITVLNQKLEEKENEFNSEKKNALKRDKTIQGLTQLLSDKEKEIAELSHEIEDRDEALSKAREAAHKAQLQKYHGAEEHQSLLMEKQMELAQLQGEHHTKVLEAQKLQRALERKEQELSVIQQAKEQLELELDDIQQQKKKGDKAFNDLNNQLKKLNGDIKDRESALEQQYKELLNERKQRITACEVTIEQLTSTLKDREQQLQEYINMIGEMEQSKSSESMSGMLSKLRQRLKEKDKALEQALDEKFTAIEEKDNEIHLLRLSLREKERDLERLNILVSHNEETINSFDSLIKEKDVELQHLTNTLKNLQRSKQEIEDNLSRSLREKDSIIRQLQSSLEGKTKDFEELSSSMLGQSQSRLCDIAEQQMSQRLKVTEAMLAQAVKDKEQLVADNDRAIEGLFATIKSKDQLLKESDDNYKHMMFQHTLEIERLRKQLSDRQQHLNAVEKECTAKVQEGLVEVAQLTTSLKEKDCFITKLLQQEKDREQFVEDSAHVLELRHTIKIMQDKLDEKEAELSINIGENNDGSVPMPKKSIIVLKKELHQKNEALNKALKRETELKLLLDEVEHRCTCQAANIASLSAALKTKDEFTETLNQRLGQNSDTVADISPEEVIGGAVERFPPKLPQREQTLIGEDNDQGTLSSQIVLQQEREALYKALKKEQQLYSSLVRAVKDPDSSQRTHALQLELTAVQLLRQQLEESIKTNEELKDDLERELHRAKLREGLDLIDPKEHESMRNQLEDAHRWNVSLQARLGAIQNRGGGVGGTSDAGHSLVFVGDQTSYLSICVGEEHDGSLSQLTSQELRDKIIELQEYITRQHVLNRELQDSAMLEKCYLPSSDNEELKMDTKISLKQPLTVKDKESQTDVAPEEINSSDRFRNRGLKSAVELSREHTHFGSEIEDKDSSVEKNSFSSLHSASETCHKALDLQIKNLQNLFEEQTSEFVEASGNSSESCGLSQKRDKMPHTNKSTMSNAQRKSNRACPLTGKTLTDTSQSNDSLCRKATKKPRALRSRLPVPVRTIEEPDAVLRQMQINIPCSDLHHDLPGSESTSEIQQTTYSTLSDAPEEQLEQPKEALINELKEKLADFKELQVQLQEKERLNLQYSEALKAAESTIAYLTACSLDNQGALGSNVTLHNKYFQLEHSLNEKKEHICELTEQLNEVDKVLNSLKCPHYDSVLRTNVKAVLQKNPTGKKHGHPDLDSNHEQEPGVDWEPALSAWLNDESDGQDDGSSTKARSQQQTATVLMNCLNAAESAIASLTVYCTSTSRSLSTTPELQSCLEKLKRALDEKEKLEDLSAFTIETDITDSISVQIKAQGAHHNLQVLYEVFRNLQQRRDLQPSQKNMDAHRSGHNSKALPPSVQNQIETLHKELREKRKVCENLEEKLATAQSFITEATSPRLKQKAVKQDEKGVQVDLQDLGYETSGKSELDREESSSTDLEIGFKPICSTSSLPSLSKQEPALFSSTENLNSVTSTYPTSPVLSSAKASLKSLRRSSLSSDVVANISETPVIPEDVQQEAQDEGDPTLEQGQIKGKTMGKSSCLNLSCERRRSVGRSRSDLFQSRSGSTSPARLESLVQSQARELSQLRNEIKETRALGALQRQQLEDLGKAFSNLIQSAKLDNLMGEEVKKQLDRSLTILDCLEGRLDRGRLCMDGESYFGFDSVTPKVTQSDEESLHLQNIKDGLAHIQQEIDKLRLDLEDERELLQRHVSLLVQQNLSMAECTRDQLDLLTRELQDKNRLIQSLNGQTGGLPPSSHHSSQSDLHCLDRPSSSPHQSLSTHRSNPGQNLQHAADWTGAGGGGVLEEDPHGHRDIAGRLQGLQKENDHLQEQLRDSRELNTTLRSELDLRCTIMAQACSRGESTSPNGAKATVDPGSSKRSLLTSDLLAEHLLEIRALRQRLEESIRNNDSLREQLEKKLADVDKDPVRAHIFIKDHEEQSLVSNKEQILLEQNQTSQKQQKADGQDKQRENDKLREALARRSAKLELSRKESATLRLEIVQVQERLECMTQENIQLQNSLHLSRDELFRLRSEVKLQGQELADSQNLLQSLRVELQVYERLKSQGFKDDGHKSQRQNCTPSLDSVDLGELLSEIKHLRLQLERSIQTNTALRQKLEEQLIRGANHSETININYLLSSTDEAVRAPGQESLHLQQHLVRDKVLDDQPVEDGESISGSSVESYSGAPSRLVPGHKMWANRNGRHVLGLIEDYNALRKQISEGRTLSHSMDTQLQECMFLIKQQCPDKLWEQQPLKSLCNSMNTQQQVLEEASRLLKLLWRVSLPVDIPSGGAGNNQQDELLKREISRLKNRVLQQEKMLSGAVKRLRTTNQLKEGMERVIIDQLALTHGVLKKARGNLEEIPVDGL